MEKEFDLSMCRIIVDNAEQSKKLQELAFKQGFNWWGHRKTATNTHERVLYFNSETSRITFSDLDTEDSKFKTFHFTDVFKETLQEKEQRLLKELEEVRRGIEDSRIKGGDWVVINDTETVFKVNNEDVPHIDDRHIKITDSVLLERLNRLFK